MNNNNNDSLQRINRALFADIDSQSQYDMHCQLLQTKSYVNYFSLASGTQSVYRHPKLHIAPDEQVISINPHLGGPLKFFKQQTNNACQIHVFEERSHQFANLCRNIALWRIQEGITPVCAAAWSATGLHTTKHDGHSGIVYVPQIVSVQQCPADEIGAVHQAYRLDDYLASQQFRPTLIECGRPGIASHIIRGAEQTIKSAKPKLLLVDSPWTDWLGLVKQWVPEYKVYYHEAGRRKAAAFLLTL